jgi:hypothetical protein
MVLESDTEGTLLGDRSASGGATSAADQAKGNGVDDRWALKGEAIA